MDKRCKNYGSSWCQDFDCPECPVRTFEFDKRIKKQPGYDPGAKPRPKDPGTKKINEGL